jgi:two-component system, chemotaxis family, protein-glutamate methylesterase/glutaminase
MEKKSIIVIGGSAGSINILMKILPEFSADFPVPIIVVVHRKQNNENVLEKLLQQKCKLSVLEIEDKMFIESNTIYIAPAEYHLLIEKDFSFSLDSSEKILNSKPSIDITMESVVDVYKNNVTGVLLSGANEDGAMGMKLIHEAGGLTITQSLNSALIKTMPKAAKNLTQIDYVLSPENIIKQLSKLVSR